MDITGGACRLTAHVNAQDCIQSFTCVESFGQGLKYRPTLVNGEADCQHPLSGLVEQLPDNHPGVASGCGCIGTAYDNVDQLRYVAVNFSAGCKRTKYQCDLGGRRIPAREFNKTR